jgi:hypothetical protein
MVMIMLDININEKTTMIVQLTTTMGVEDKTTHHVHRYNNATSHVL